jgi:hypothetical protein
MRKPDVRALAASAGLRTSEKKDSQEICFVPSNDYRKLLAEHKVEMHAGEIVDTGGNRLGEHAGTENFTIGQRRGHGIASTEPLYVVDLLRGRCRRPRLARGVPCALHARRRPELDRRRSARGERDALSRPVSLALDRHARDGSERTARPCTSPSTRHSSRSQRDRGRPSISGIVSSAEAGSRARSA